MRYDALIVGAGPGGATAALILARAGWSAALVEKSEFPRRKVCGEFISATNLPLLERLGLAAPFLDTAGPEVRQFAVYTKDAAVSADMPGVAKGPIRWGRALGREHLDLMLLDAAAVAGATVWQPYKVVGLRPTGCGHVCELAGAGGRMTLAASIVILATGSWERSPVEPAEAVAIHRPSDLLAFKAHFRDGDLRPGLMPVLAFPGGYGGMVRTDNARITVACCIRRDRLRQLRAERPGAAADAVQAHLEASCAGVRDALRRARLEAPWLAAGPIRPGVRPRFAEGIFRVGNIAGEAHPIVGEGISMALQSAALLCAQLTAASDDTVAGRGRAELGRAYARAWDQAFRPRLRAAAVFAELASRPAMSRPVVAAFARFPRLLTWAARLSGKIEHVKAGFA